MKIIKIISIEIKLWNAIVTTILVSLFSIGDAQHVHVYTLTHSVNIQPKCIFQPQAFFRAGITAKPEIFEATYILSLQNERRISLLKGHFRHLANKYLVDRCLFQSGIAWRCAMVWQEIPVNTFLWENKVRNMKPHYESSGNLW